jgi:hypothetical protein
MKNEEIKEASDRFEFVALNQFALYGPVTTADVASAVGQPTSWAERVFAEYPPTKIKLVRGHWVPKSTKARKVAPKFIDTANGWQLNPKWVDTTSKWIHDAEGNPVLNPNYTG